MVDSNLQREMIRPSEKAFAYKMKYEATVRCLLFHHYTGIIEVKNSRRNHLWRQKMFYDSFVRRIT